MQSSERPTQGGLRKANIKSQKLCSHCTAFYYCIVVVDTLGYGTPSLLQKNIDLLSHFTMHRRAHFQCTIFHVHCSKRHVLDQCRNMCEFIVGALDTILEDTFCCAPYLMN